MRILLAVICTLAFGAAAVAEDVRYTFDITPPVEDVDGNPITDADIKSYKLYYSPTKDGDFDFLRYVSKGPDPSKLDTLVPRGAGCASFLTVTDGPGGVSAPSARYCENYGGCHFKK